MNINNGQAPQFTLHVLLFVLCFIKNTAICGSIGNVIGASNLHTEAIVGTNSIQNGGHDDGDHVFVGLQDESNQFTTSKTSDQLTDSDKDAYKTDAPTSHNNDNNGLSSGGGFMGDPRPPLKWTTNPNLSDMDNNDDFNEQQFTEPEEVEIPYDKNPCVLGTASDYLYGWLNTNGTLVDTFDHEVYAYYDSIKTGLDMSFGLFRTPFLPAEARSIEILSLAHNDLTEVPSNFLEQFSTTLQRLSLTGNNFSQKSEFKYGSRIWTWSQFPRLENLTELDIRNCNIRVLENDAFQNLSNLKVLYLAHNSLTTLNGEIFRSLSLYHLDLSDITNDLLDIDEYTFCNTPNLEFLDLSRTKLTEKSVKFLEHLPAQLHQLSLCFSELPILTAKAFSKTAVKVLDLSGNPKATHNLRPDSLLHIGEHLEVMVVEHNNLQMLNGIDQLSRLKILKIANNYVSALTNETFANLTELELLDLSSNHVSNWFWRVFAKNSNLKVLNLRSNNINVITTEMYKDFGELEYLALGGNDFICNCVLRDFFDTAARNTKNSNCTVVSFEDQQFLENETELEKTYNYKNDDGYYYIEKDVPRKMSNKISEIVILRKDPVDEQLDEKYDIIFKLYWDMFQKLSSSYENMKTAKKLLKILTFEIYKPSKSTIKNTRLCRCKDDDREYNPDLNYTDLFVSTEMDFEFQLLDFEDNDYKCFNATSNDQYFLTEIDRCPVERGWEDISNLRETTNSIAIILGIVFSVAFIILILYYKWWYIRYFFMLVKNATILSFMDKEKSLIKNIEVGDVSYMYDVFISYCDENREWVLNELLPNIEQSTQINACLHERDFQVGLSILENIISCMDKSRCLLLVISQNFLLSQWCQFEMYLAQHRLLETCQEHLILVLLEDIPKRKRPKTLSYLMRTKTYIQWPKEGSKKKNKTGGSEEHKLFWRRLRRALIGTDFEPESST